HREMSRSTGEVPESVKKLLQRLRNPEETGGVILTFAEATTVLGAAGLQEERQRAQMAPKWLVINQSLYATDTTDAILKGRAVSEVNWIKKVKDELAQQCAVIPWLHEEKIGYCRFEIKSRRL